MDVDCGGVWNNDLFKFRWTIAAGGHNKDEEGYNGGNKGHDTDKQTPGDVPVAQGDVHRVDGHTYDDAQGCNMGQIRNTYYR